MANQINLTAPIPVFDEAEEDPLTFDPPWHLIEDQMEGDDSEWEDAPA